MDRKVDQMYVEVIIPSIRMRWRTRGFIPLAALSYTRKHVVYGEITTHTAWMEIVIVSDMQVYIPELQAPPVGGSLRPGSPARSWSLDGLV